MLENLPNTCYACLWEDALTYLLHDCWWLMNIVLGMDFTQHLDVDGGGTVVLNDTT